MKENIFIIQEDSMESFISQFKNEIEKVNNFYTQKRNLIQEFLNNCKMELQNMNSPKSQVYISSSNSKIFKLLGRPKLKIPNRKAHLISLVYLFF